MYDLYTLHGAVIACGNKPFAYLINTLYLNMAQSFHVGTDRKLLRHPVAMYVQHGAVIARGNKPARELGT